MYVKGVIMFCQGTYVFNRYEVSYYVFKNIMFNTYTKQEKRKRKKMHNKMLGRFSFKFWSFLNIGANWDWVLGGKFVHLTGPAGIPSVILLCQAIHYQQQSQTNTYRSTR